MSVVWFLIAVYSAALLACAAAAIFHYLGEKETP